MRVSINRHANDPRSAFSQYYKHEEEMARKSEVNHRGKNETTAADARATAEVTRQALMRRKGYNG